MLQGFLLGILRAYLEAGSHVATNAERCVVPKAVASDYSAPLPNRGAHPGYARGIPFCITLLPRMSTPNWCLHLRNRAVIGPFIYRAERRLDCPVTALLVEEQRHQLHFLHASGTMVCTAHHGAAELDKEGVTTTRGTTVGRTINFN